MSIYSSNRIIPKYRHNAFAWHLLCLVQFGFVLYILMTINFCTAHAGEQLKDNPDSTIKTQQTTKNPLKAFFEAAKKLDSSVREATLIYESAIKNLSGKNMTADTARIILDLIAQTPDAQELNRLIPPGLQPALEAEVLRILANLVSRISGLRGTFYHSEMANPGEPIVIRTFCLQNVISSQDRFETHMKDATTLAHSQPFSRAAPDSKPAGELAIRLEYIWKVNTCCDSCGGHLYEKPIDINWKNHMADGIGFDATFNGQEWEVVLQAG